MNSIPAQDIAQRHTSVNSSTEICFDNPVTRSIDAQYVIAPQYGISGPICSLEQRVQLKAA